MVRASGVLSYTAKPVDVERLESLLRSCLSRRPLEPLPMRRSGGSGYCGLPLEPRYRAVNRNASLPASVGVVTCTDFAQSRA
jgi:hypothetical protein